MTVKLVISAGHNAKQVGATFEGFSEYPETSKWAKKIASFFPQESVLILDNMLLSAKIRRINQLTPTPILALEVHFNSSARGGKGSETLYCPGSDKSKAAAGFIQAELAKISQPNRGIKEGWYKMDHDRRIPDGFLSQTRPTAVILEPLFVQQKAQFSELFEPSCEAIALGIRNYFKFLQKEI